MAIYPFLGSLGGKQRFQGHPLWCFCLPAFVQKGTPQNVGPLPQGSWKFKDQIDHEIDNMGDRETITFVLSMIQIVEKANTGTGDLAYKSSMVRARCPREQFKW